MRGTPSTTVWAAMASGTPLVRRPSSSSAGGTAPGSPTTPWSWTRKSWRCARTGAGATAPGTPEVAAFEALWLQWVRSGAPRDKSGLPVVPERARSRDQDGVRSGPAFCRAGRRIPRPDLLFTGPPSGRRRQRAGPFYEVTNMVIDMTSDEFLFSPSCEHCEEPTKRLRVGLSMWRGLA